jgi:hypothetical protein
MVIFAVAMISCHEKEKENSDDFIVSGVIANYAEWKKISASFDFGDTWAVTSPVSNGKFTLKLPVPDTQYFEDLFDEFASIHPDGITFSNRNAKIIEAEFYIRNDSKEKMVILEGVLDKGEFWVRYFYVDRDVNITGSGTFAGEDAVLIYDVQMKKGWNIVVFYEKMSNGTWTGTIATDPIPAGAGWIIY